MDDETIEQRLSALKVDLKDIGDKIISQIASIHSSNCENIDLKDDPRNCLRSLRFDLDDILKTAESKRELLEEYALDFEKSQNIVSNLELLNAAADYIAKLEDVLPGNKINVMVKAALDMEDSINRLPPGIAFPGNSSVISALKLDANAQRSFLVSKLMRLFDCCVVFDFATVQVNHELTGFISSEDLLIDSDSDIKLKDIWQGLLSLGYGEQVCRSIARLLWFKVLKPLWGDKSGQGAVQLVKGNGKTAKSASLTLPACIDHKKESTAAECIENGIAGFCNNVQISMEISSSGVGGLEVCKMSFPAMLENLLFVFQFLCSEILCDNDELIAIMNNCLFNGLPLALGNLLCSLLTNMLPHAESGLVNFKGLVQKPCADFEDKIEKIFKSPLKANQTNSVLSGAPNVSISPLSDIVDSMTGKWCESARSATLTRSRDILLSDYRNTMSGTGDALEDDSASAGSVGDKNAMLEHSANSGFQALSFEVCQISLAAWRTLRLIHEQMKESCKSLSLVTAQSIYQTARDCAELFLSVIPVKYSQEIDSLPRMGAVFYNDCNYIAHNCSLLTFTYRQQMKNPELSVLRESMGFVDFVPRFRLAGQRCLAKHVETQKGILLGFVKRIRITPEGSTEENNSGIPVNNDEGAMLIIKHLEQLRNQIYTVLPETIYQKVMGYLIECVIRSAVQPVIESECITESAVSDICRIFKYLLKAKDVLIFNKTSDSQQDLDVQIVPSWKKFGVLTELLDFNTSEVMESLNRGKFSCFTAQELGSLIKALFEDSDKRKALLNKVLEITS